MACTGYGAGFIGRYGKVEGIPYHCRKAIPVFFHGSAAYLCPETGCHSMCRA
nr:hypothetical protein [Oribacterium sp. NK2B42]